MRTIIWIAALMPIFYMSFRYSLGQGWQLPIVMAKFLNGYLHLHIGWYPGNIIKFLEVTTAKTALNLLILTLALKPLHSYLKFDLLKYKRLIGLFGAFYVLLHVAVFVWLKHHFDFGEIYGAFTHHLFIIFGVLAFAVLLMMSITSVPFLFRKFHSWHKLFYISMVFVMVHFLLAQKNISFTDIIYVAVISALLALKLLKR
ncbi:ferric reductase-like transmembrane domain-containing protein [bacterium]|nr:ferric reductase-like transmembrane domain-containing protein [bacterium]MBU1883628.1 ferric reductase-like transmembrane domain-containing protein [bacterium]